jgi:copper homeostasis protein
VNPPVLVEVCVDSLDGALAAVEGGAGRIELCAGLAEGGTTPSLGLIEAVREAVSVELIVLLRPRPGDFLYSEGELDLMLRDAAHARNAGADGLALGILRANGSVDGERTRALVEATAPLSVTFHRAFDLARDACEALEGVLASGCRRLLTSGQAARAPEGLATLRTLVATAGDGLSVIPAGGLQPDNVVRVVRESGAHEVHLSASGRCVSAMGFRREGLALGAGTLPGEYERRATRAELVCATVAAVAGLERA